MNRSSGGGLHVTDRYSGGFSIKMQFIVVREEIGQSGWKLD